MSKSVSWLPVLVASECLHATRWDEATDSRRSLCQPNVDFAFNERPMPHMIKWRKCTRCVAKVTP